MGSMFSSSSNEEIDMALSKVKYIVSSTPVVVFSKTYCQYCKRVKQLLSQLGATYKVIELDKESDGSEIQSALEQCTGQRTVPSVFIGGKQVGGCDAVNRKTSRWQASSPASGCRRNCQRLGSAVKVC